MSIVFIDGFDHYTITNMTRKWTSNTIGSAMVTGRTGAGQALQLTTTGSCEKVFNNTSQAWRIGFAVNLQSQTGSTFQVISLKDNTSSQVELTWLNSRRFQFSRNGTLVGSAGATTLSTSTWYYIEFYVSIKDSISLGNAQLYINGVQELNLPATTDIKNTANSFADRVNISGGGFWSFYIDDFVVSQEADTTTPTFLGDRKVATLYPDGSGNYSDFTGSDGNSVNNYQLVDETLTDDNDYVTGDAVSFRDSYSFTNPSQTPTTVDAIQVVSNIRKDDTGSRTGRTFVRVSGTNYEGSDITLSTSYIMDCNLYTSNPNTTLAWTASDVNALEAGVKVQS